MPASRVVGAMLSVFSLAGCGAAASAAPSPSSSWVAATPAPATRAAHAPPAPSHSPTAAPSHSPTAAPSHSPAPASAAATGATIESRMAAVRAFIAKKPGTLGLVVRDRVTGAVWRAGNTTQLNWTASTIKLALASAILERARAGQVTLTAADQKNMRLSLVNSDNDATTALWTKFDGAALLTRFRTTYGMSTLGVVSGYTVFWRNLHCSTRDLADLMSYVLDKMDATDRAYLVTTLRGVATFQHWGVWGAGPSLRPGNKDGWAQKPDNGVTHWVTHSVGFAGDHERFVVAVTYRLTAAGTLPQGAHTVSDLVATVFGAKLPASISFPG